jgi:hypothetical protein
LATIKVRYLERRRLSGGQTAFYYCPPDEIIEAGILIACPLGTDEGEAVGKAQTYNKLLDEWRAGDIAKPEFAPGTIGWLVAEFKASSWYDVLKPKTKKGYDADLDRITNYKLKSGKKFGLYLAASVTPKMTDAMYAKLKPAGLRTANGIMVMAHRLWKYGIKYHGKQHGIDINPFRDMGLTKPDARSEQWTMGQVEAFVDEADKLGWSSIGTAAWIIYGFNQRVTTALTVTWPSWDGQSLLVKQSKRGRWVWVPALPEVRTRLNKLKESRGDSVTIVNYEATGRPFDEDQFSKKAAIVREAAGIPDHLQLRDLRRTGITETRAGGATDHELQATSGNDLESLQIYSVPSNAEAASAIRKRQRHRTKLRRSRGSGSV